MGRAISCMAPPFLAEQNLCRFWVLTHSLPCDRPPSFAPVFRIPTWWSSPKNRCVMEAALHGGHKDDAPCWESLPPAVLGRCLLGVPREDERSNIREASLRAARRERAAMLTAAFSTCKAFTKALLGSATKPRVTIELGGRDQDSLQALLTVLCWAAPCCASLELKLTQSFGRSAPVSLQLLLDLLHQRDVSLPTVTTFTCWAVLLDSRPPASLATVLPNLQWVELQRCSIPASTLPLEGCSQLKKLKLCRDYSHEAVAVSNRQAWLPQLQQLASLPSLSSLHIDPELFPTSFLPLLAGQLTKLGLGNLSIRETLIVEQCQRWEAALADAAQCANVRKLRLSGVCTAPHLGMLTRLTQLQEISIRDSSPGVYDTDGLVTMLLRFPHLTRLTCNNLGDLQQSSANSPCSWKQLELGIASPQLLCRLPLHSLAQPLQLGALRLDQPGLSVADVQAAVRILANNVQLAPLVRCVPSTHTAGQGLMNILFAEDGGSWSASPAALLRVAGPLVCQDMNKVVIRNAEVDAELVRALQEVAPSSITALDLYGCSTTPSFWVQLAHSFPHLQQLVLAWVQGTCSGVQVMSYYAAVCARHAASGQQPGMLPQAADMAFHVHEDSFEAWGLHEVQAAVQLLGLQANVLIAS